MVLLRVDGKNDQVSVVLRDPNGSGDALLVVDRIRFEHAWTGEVVLVKRNYEISDESQAFSRKQEVMTGPVLWGQRVHNEHTTVGDQIGSAVAALADGRFVVT